MNELQADNIIARLEAEIERLQAAYDSRGGEMDSMRMVLAETQKWNEDRLAEIERLTATADAAQRGLRAEIEQLKEEVATCRELREYDRGTIEEQRKALVKR